MEISTPSGEKAHIFSGVTRDISVGGIYFTTEQESMPSLQLDFRLVLPAQLVQGTDVLVLARGKVLRVEKTIENAKERAGVAVGIETFEIIRPKS